MTNNIEKRESNNGDNVKYNVMSIISEESNENDNENSNENNDRIERKKAAKAAMTKWKMARPKRK